MSGLETVLVSRKVRIDREPITGQRRSEMPEYRVWAGMRARCMNPNASGYARYGGRGIKVCDHWLEDFAHFYADMGPRPSGRHSIDRIDNDGDYEPGNCRWALPNVQAANRSPSKEADRSSEYFWSQNDLQILHRMFEQYAPLEEIASVLGRSYGTVRLRAYNEGLRRDASISKLAKKHPSLAPVLREKGVKAFLEALKIHLEAQKAEKQRLKSASSAKTQALITEILARQISRNDKMRALRLAGVNMAQIGQLFGLTRERVRQLQLTNFEEPVGAGRRKIYSIRSERADQQVERLIRAWNVASAAARARFQEAVAGHDVRDKLPRLKAQVNTAHKFSEA